jgi:uncharacterized protein
VDLVLGPDRLVVCRLPSGAPWPSPSSASSFYVATRSPDELSVVCHPDDTPAGARVEAGWSLLSVVGPLDFAAVWVMASLTGVLAAAGVSIFVVSTFDTDHLLVRSSAVGSAVDALRAAGHTVTSP